MAQRLDTDEPVQLQVENVGGITETTVELTPGITILTGRNATNRTSLMQAIMAVLGSDSVSLKGDADEGYVELSVGGTTYTRTLRRKDGTVVTSGDPYLKDATLADLFAFLLETNDARQAVVRDDDLRETIMEPVDTTDIEAEIDRLRSRRDSLDDELEKISQVKQRLPDLEQERVEIEDEIAEKRNRLAELEAEIADVDESVDEKREEKEAFEEKIDELNKVRSQLESVRRQIDSQRESLNALREEREELEADREDYKDLPDGRLDGVKAEIQRLRDKKTGIDSTVDELQTVVQFNQDLLDGNLDLLADLGDRDDDTNGGADLTEQLLEDGEDLVCWTCGNETDTTQVETMLDDLRSLRNEYMEQRSDLDDRIDELNEERRQIEEKQRQHRQIDDRLAAVEDEIEEREARVEELTDRKADLTGEVEHLESKVEKLQTDDDQEELLDLHTEANRLEVEIDRLETDLQRVEDEIEEIEARGDDREEIEQRRDEVQAEIEELRTRVERLEEEAVAQFNDHMESVLEILDYENLERIWIEQTEDIVRQDRKNVTENRYDLHVVRKADSGTIYEDTIDHLSESEREVTGLVFALAGYLVHDVHEEVPFMLLDSIEAIDAPRIAALVDYFEAHAEHLVVALLTEDARVLDDDYQRITNI